jgi:catechol 2,3-dioxygenase-like lactoylglutathione lyase family enzyme
MESRLDHCVMHVSDRRRSNAFYRDVLGAELVGDPDGVAMYRFGEQQLNVHGPGFEPDPVARLPVQPGGSDLCFVWRGPIEDAIDHLRAHGVVVELGPVRRGGAGGEGRSVTSATLTAACSNSSRTAEEPLAGHGVVGIRPTEGPLSLPA